MNLSLVRHADLLERLEHYGSVIQNDVTRVSDYNGWVGRDVVAHLAAYTGVVGAMLRSEVEHRPPTETEIFGRELTQVDTPLGTLDENNEAIRREYAALSWNETIDLWRSRYSQVVDQLNRLSDAQLAAPGPNYLPDALHRGGWEREHLADVVWTLIEHYEFHLGRS